MSECDQKFDSHSQWVNKSRSWLTRHEKYSSYFRAFCFDSKGMICQNGSDFAKAVFPVYWVWPDQNLFEKVKEVVNATQT